MLHRARGGAGRWRMWSSAQALVNDGDRQPARRQAAPARRDRRQAPRRAARRAADRRYPAGYDAVGWFGLAAPKDTPPEIVNRINAETNAALADPQFKAQLANLGVEPMVPTPDGYTKFIAGEVDKWDKVIRHAAIKPD